VTLVQNQMVVDTLSAEDWDGSRERDGDHGSPCGGSQTGIGTAHQRGKITSPLGRGYRKLETS
jgi:hypothetical protein